MMGEAGSGTIVFSHIVDSTAHEALFSKNRTQAMTVTLDSGLNSSTMHFLPSSSW